MIYCVEDERNIRELLVYTLETTGFEAEGFETGAELDTAMKKNLPELILLDIMLLRQNMKHGLPYIFMHTLIGKSVKFPGCSFLCSQCIP